MLNNNLKSRFLVIAIVAFSIILACFRISAAAWQEPSLGCEAPDCNRPAPLYKQSGAQEGPLNIKDMVASSGKGTIEANKYCLCSGVTGNCSADKCISSWAESGIWTKDPVSSKVYYNDANVGIGTSVASEKLEISTNVRSVLSIRGDSNADWVGTVIKDTSGNEKWFMGANGNKLLFRRNGTTNDMVINTNGNVGIGTTAPKGLLDVAVNGNYPNIILSVDTSSANNNADYWIKTLGSGGATDVINYIENWGGNYIWQKGSASGPVEIMRIDANNNRLGIGTNAPNDKLDVSGKIIAEGIRRKGSSDNTLGSSDDVFNYIFDNGMDGIAYQPPFKCEYWDGASWIDWGIDSCKNLLDHNISTQVVLNSTRKGFRVTFKNVSQYNFLYYLYIDGEYTGNAGQTKIGTLSVEISNDDITYTQSGTVNVDAYGVDSLYVNKASNQAYFRVSFSSDLAAGETKSIRNLKYFGQRQSYAKWPIATSWAQNIGLGTIAPSAKLQVNSPTDTEGVRIITSNYSPFVIRNSADNADIFRVDQSGNLTITGNMSGLNIGGWTKSGNNLYATDVNDKVGIGTTAPGAKLEVATGANTNVQIGQAANNSNYNALSLNGSRTDAGIVGLLGGGTGDNNLYLSSPDSLIFRANGGNEKMRILSAGNVGIGTSAPGYKLQVAGDIYANGGWLRTSGSAGWYSESYGGGWYMQDTSWIRAYNSKSVWVDNVLGTNGGLTVGYGGVAPGAGGAIISGNVGIGTNAPSAQLNLADVYSAGGRNLLIGDDTFLTDIDVANTLGIYGNQDNTIASLKFGSGGGTISGYNNNIGIGTATPSAKLQVNPPTDTEGLRIISSNYSPFIIRNTANNADIFRVDQSGNLTITGGVTGLSIGGWTKSGNNLYATDANDKVGIGTTAPAGKLHVTGATFISPATYAPANIPAIHTDLSDTALFVPTTSGGNLDLRLYIDDDAADRFSIWGNSCGGGGCKNLANASEVAQFRADGTIYLKGNVGIGTAASGYKLQVAGDIYANGGWLRTSGSAGWYSESYGGGWHMQDANWIRTYNSKSVWTNTGLLGTNGGLTVGYGGVAPGAGGAIISGNVGIGTNVPDGKLDVETPQNVWGVSLLRSGTRVGGLHSNGGILTLQASSGGAYVAVANNGNVGIGTNAPGAKLEIFDSANPSLRLAYASGYGFQMVNDANGGNPYLRLQYIVPNNSVYSTPLSINYGGNVGIGTNAPSAQLNLADVYSAGGRNLLIGDDTFLTDIDVANTLGIYGNQDNTIASLKFGSGGGTISGYNNNIGIGTATPNKKLEVNGITRITRPSASDTYLDTTIGDVSAYFNGYDPDGWMSMYFQSNGNTRMAILGDTGKVGIGTAAPSEKLQVAGNIKLGGTEGDVKDINQLIGYNDLFIKGNSEEAAPIYYGASEHKFYTGGTQKLTILNNGNVGIGTTAPGAKIEVKHSGSGEGTSVFPSGEWAAKVFMTQDSSNYGGLVVGSRWANNDNIVFQAGNLFNTWNPYFTVKGGGNVGIGTITPSEKLEVAGNTNITGNLTIGGTFSAASGAADLAEEFTTKEEIEKGTVLIMGDDGYKSAKPCDSEYDTKVIGVVSDNAAVIMGVVASEHKAVVTISGVVTVKVSAKNSIIKKGDLLTTSDINGYAMKAIDAKIGTVIGKALEGCDNEKCNIKALINLQ